MSKPKAPDTNSWLAAINDTVHNQFVERKNILSFDRFFSLFLEHPTRFTRSAYQYVDNMIEYFGPRESEGGGKRGGFAVFDLPFDDDRSRVWGQAAVEHEIVRVLKGFARGGRADKLILLHGPNGSAKSSLVGCLHRGLEKYSQLDEGALYRFNWVFPEEHITREKIGFSKSESMPINAEESFAYLPDDRIAARISCPLHDNPLFLVPKKERERVFEKLAEENEDFAKHELSRYLAEGDLSPKNKLIYNTLLSSYGGDYGRILQHIQVERYYISGRYKVGSVTIEPQLSVDAGFHQLTADRSLSALPPVLQNLSLFEPVGHLVQANHGIVEYSDLLKRPLDSYKYLLVACETGTINVDPSRIALDLLMIGSSNDKYLESFKQIPDFTSFKGRMEFVRVPYLRSYLAEQKIYDTQLLLGGGDKVVAPHLTEIVALWCVLTRLRKPDPEHYAEQVRPVIEKLNPLEKAMFYANGDAPEWATVAQSKEMRSLRGRLQSEFNSGPGYEGAIGASPREGKMILQNTMQNVNGPCVTPLHALGEIRRLISDPSVYEWLQVEPDGEFMNQKELIRHVEDYYIAKVDNELKIAMEMIEETQYASRLQHYVALVSAWLHKSRIVDKLTGKEKEVDVSEIEEIEKIIAPEDDPLSFRQDVVSRVGAYALDHPDTEVAYERIFQPQINRLKEHYFHQQQKRIQMLNDNLLVYMSDRKKALTEEAVEEVESALKQMEERFGYDPVCTREIVTALMQKKYGQVSS